jgi:hypothetical protein
MSWVDRHEPGEEEKRLALNDLYGELKGVQDNTTPRRKKHKMDHERKGKKGRRSPVTDYVRSLGDYFTTAEVAEQVGRSEGWVRKAAEKRWTQAPSYVAPYGDTHVNLYTKEDVKALKKYIVDNQKVYRRDEFPQELR